MTELLDPIIVQFVTLKGATAIVVFLIMLGYALKMIPFFQNRYIPLVNFSVGPLLTPILMEWPTAGSMAPGLRYPEVGAWATSIMAGFLLACVAWLMHAQFLRKFIDEKIPALTPGRTVDRTETKETHTDEGESEKTKTVTEKTTETKDDRPTPEGKS